VLFLGLLLLAATPVLAQEEPVEEPVDRDTAAVLPARGDLSQRTLTDLTSIARSALRDNDYDLASQNQVRSAVRTVKTPAPPTNRYRDQDLFDLGRTLKVDLVVHPRIVSRPGKPVRLAVDSARVSRETVWRCRRELDDDGSGRSRDERALEALEICLDRLLAKKPTKVSWQDIKKKQQPRKKRKKKRDLRWKREHYFGTLGIVIPWGVQKLAIDRGDERIVGYIDYEVSGAFGGFYEKRVKRVLAFGVQLEYLMLWKAGAKKTEKAYKDERLGIFNVGATMRVLYPGKWAEPYAKLVLGLSAVSAPDAAQNGDVTLGSGAGPCYELKLGTMITFPYVGLFIEAGFGVTTWFPGDSVVLNEDQEPVSYDEITGVEGEVLLGFGLVAFF
jgi:hypothetical protein